MIQSTIEQDKPLATSKPRSRALRWGYRSLALLLVIVVVILGARSWLSSERSVDASRLRVAEVTRGTLVRDIVTEARVIAANSPTLFSTSAGTVDLHVAAGETVERDQAMATLTSPALASLLAREQATLAGLEAELGRAEIAVELERTRARSQVEQATIDQQTASRELERSQEGFDFGAVPELEFLRAKDNLRKTEIALGHARSMATLEVKGLAFDLTAKNGLIERQREVVRELTRQVEALVIRSPVDGVVGQLLVDQRASIGIDAPIMSVVDLSAFELDISVPDSFARELAIGMAAEIDVNGKSFEGSVSSVSPEVVNGQVGARVIFSGETPKGLRQNQRVRVRILIEERPDVLMVERGPALERGGGHVAYVLQGDVATRRAIVTGKTSLDAVEILSGVTVGERIVVSGTDTFGDTERVRVVGQ